MNIGVATAIFKHLDNKSYSNTEKVEALDAVVNMETDNGITKADYKCALNWLWTHIEKESAVDAVEVVRCKECNCLIADDSLCYLDGRGCKADDYCSWAERIKNEVER